MKPIYRNIGRAVAVALIGLGIISEDQLGHMTEVVTEGVSIIMLVVIELQSWISKLKGK